MASSSDQQKAKNGVDDDGNERSVTDPVTHQPVEIHDVSNLDLEQLPPPPTDKDEKKRLERDDGRSSFSRHQQMDALVHEMTHGNWWEDPLGDQQRTRVQTALVAGAASGAGALGAILCYWSIIGRGSGLILDVIALIIGCVFLAIGVAVASVSFRLIQGDAKSIPDFHHTESKDIHRLLEHNGNTDGPETVAWLNSFLKALWPIINPSLFVSVTDILEDSLQTTLPKFIYGVRVADLGQGSEPVRVLAVRWLDPGAAGKDVDGMKAEEGDFVNLEMSLAYRAKETTGKGLRSRSVNAHILMQFYLAGGVVLPVWVELTGLLATARMRIQLTPNPPFLSLMTLTLLGKPKVTMKCIPMAKNFLNVMDVPFLSSWIQSSIDAVTVEYVAPRSINLDLKTMLAGRPKMDTDAIGVIIVTIRSARDFGIDKPRNALKNPTNKGADMYVTVGWSKWGKPLWSTRMIQQDGSPVWEETTALLVTHTELDAQEGVQLQCWDSDRFTADDLHGQIGIPLNDIMSNPGTRNHLVDRCDSLKTPRGDPAKGELLWEVGYFDKTTLEQHLERKHMDYYQVRDDIEHAAERKLREAMAAGDEKESEVAQQKEEDLKERSDEIISGSAPTQDWPSGILSIRIEQISGLEVEKIRESGVRDDGEDDSETDNMPSAYCTIILNHQRIYKTRTKMKSTNPYFDAGTERFIKNWKTATVIVSVRDNRQHETDPILGIVHLPLRDVLKHRSQWIGSLPIIGGIGYGRMRLSLTFRSIQLRLPRRLLGWDVGTLEIESPITATIHMPTEFANANLVFRTSCDKGKMKPRHEGGWASKKGRPVRLAVKKRYASALVIQLRKTRGGPDVTPAYCTLWLKDIPDDEEVQVSLPVCRNNPKHMLQRAAANAVTEVNGEGDHDGADYGRLEFKVKFWSGLSGYHHYLADKDANVADAMEVLDSLEAAEKTRGHGPDSFPEGDGYVSEDIDSEDGDDDSESTPYDDSVEGEEGEDDLDIREDGHLKVSREPRAPFKDFKAKHGELHRRHRGLMQWKTVRHVAWVGRGVEEAAEKVGDKIFGTFKHREKEHDIETEV